MATAKKKLVQWEPTDVKKELLKQYPPKVARKRAKQILINEALENDTPEIVANVRTIPGIITMRGCTYAGCKGVIMGPTRDIVNLVHGPIGCSFYAWLTRRNQTDAGVDGERREIEQLPRARRAEAQEALKSDQVAHRGQVANVALQIRGDVAGKPVSRVERALP